MIKSRSIMWFLIQAVFLLLLPCDVHSQFVSRGPDVLSGNAAFNGALDRIYSKLQPLFQKLYPQVISTNFHSNGICFEYQVTTFSFSSPTNNSGKHESDIQMGPKEGGILCTIYLESNKYYQQIALVRVNGGVPSLLRDRKFYKQLLMSPESAKLDAHLSVSLSYPADASEDFLKEFQAIMLKFQNDAD